MQRLVAGVHHFSENIFASQRELFQRLAGGQNPDALFITCSDSRIIPNDLTQTKPGELFLLRNAGNVVPPCAHGAAHPHGGEAATIEFAIRRLGVRDIIVCGHTCCGAMQALLDPAAISDLPALDTWLQHGREARALIERHYAHLSLEDRLNAITQENVLVQLEHLRTHPAVREGIASGKVNLHGWVYKLEAGQVYSFDPADSQFKLLAGHSVPTDQLLLVGRRHDI